MTLVTNSQHSTVSRAWGKITSGHATKADYREIGIDSTKDPLCKRFCRALARSIANRTLTAEFDCESQHLLLVNSSGEWKARFKPGAMRATYEAFFYEFFLEAGHEYGACPVAAAVFDLSSLPPIEAQQLNPDAFGEEDERPNWTEFGVMYEDLFNRQKASHLPQKVENILPGTLLQPTGLVYGVITPRMQSREFDLVSRSKEMLLAAALGMRDGKEDAWVGRIIDAEEIMPEPYEVGNEADLLRQRSANSMSSSGYGTDRHILELAAFSSKKQSSEDSDDDISFTVGDEEGPAILCSNLQSSSASHSSSESEDEDEDEVIDYRRVKIAADTAEVSQSGDKTLLNTDIHFPILGEDFETANQMLTSDQIRELKEFVNQIDQEALIRFVVSRRITHRDPRLEVLELDRGEEQREVAFEDGSAVLIQESGREEEFFPAKQMSETRLFTQGQITGFKNRLSNLKDIFDEIEEDEKTNLVQLISRVVPSFGCALEALDECRSRKLAGKRSGLNPKMERELQLDAAERSFAKAKFCALGRRRITVETECLSPSLQSKISSSQKV